MANIFPPDYTIPLGQLRALLFQTKQYVDPANPDEPADYLVPDEHLEAFLALNPTSIHKAAADALMGMATNEVLISKKIRTEDLQTDGPAVAGELRRMADMYYQRAKDEAEALDAESSFEVIDFVPLPENWLLR